MQLHRLTSATVSWRTNKTAEKSTMNTYLGDFCGGSAATPLSSSVRDNIGGGLVKAAALEPNQLSGQTEALILRYKWHRNYP